MKKYQVIEHTADLKIKVFARTKKELFSNFLLALSEILVREKGGKKVKRNIEVHSFDFPALLVDFLNQVIFLSQTNKEFYDKIQIKEFSEKKIKGFLFGRKIERFKEDIKAATYHDLEVKKNKNLWEAVVLFDV